MASVISWAHKTTVSSPLIIIFAPDKLLEIDYILDAIINNDYHTEERLMLTSIDKIEKCTGLDIRKFDDALTYRIAVMVLAHMKDQRG